MAAIRTVLIDKFSTFGNPFVSLATSISSMFSSSAQVEELPKPDVAAVATEAARPQPGNFRVRYSSSKRFIKHPRMHTSLRRLLTGKGDFGLEDGRFVHALDFLDEIDKKEIDLESLPTIESDYESNDEEVST